VKNFKKDTKLRRRGLSLATTTASMQDTGSPELFEEPLTFSTYKK
jgi:hypothetical protein